MAGDRSIRLANVSKTFVARGERFTALDDVALECEPGSFTALIGPSGCGKSTLLRLALGLDQPDAGEIRIGGLTPKQATASGDTGATGRDEPDSAAIPATDNETVPTAAPAPDSQPPRKTREGTKQAQLIDMLRRPEGATIAEIVKATGWLAHTVRGAMAGALKKKLGLEVTSEKIEGRGRTYRIAG